MFLNRRSNLDQIEVEDLEGKNRATLVARNMTSPRAGVLDRRVGCVAHVFFYY